MTQLETMVLLGVSLFIVFYAYNAYRVDRLRQDLFDVRDKLFDEAAHGRIKFDSPAYIGTRTLINGMIRFAHDTGVANFVSFRFFVPKELSQSKAQEFQALIFSKVTSEDQELCKKYITLAHEKVARHLLTAPSLALLYLPILFLVATFLGLNSIRVFVQRWNRSFAALDGFAYGEGGRRNC